MEMYLSSEAAKSIILDSLGYLIKDKSVLVFGDVIMPNHIHLIWYPLKQKLQLRFIKYTAQKLKFYLKDHDSKLLNELVVNKKDRAFQIWQRNPQAKEIIGRNMLEQKLDYIHNNPCQGKWMLANEPTQYLYSSASYYELGTPNPLITHYMEYI